MDDEMEQISKTSDSKKRQIEINEWNYHEKMETLFILQLLFIAFSATIILITLSKYGFFSRIFAIYTGIIVTGILLFVGVLRRLYTKNVRDKTHWNERVFDGDHTLGSLVPPAVLAATSTANTKVCNAIKGGTSTTAKPVSISCP